MAAVAPAAYADSETYDFETDLWPAIQAEMQAQSQVDVAQSDARHLPGLSFSDAGTTMRQPHDPGVYDEFDRYLDPQTGIPRPEARELFGE
jgi:hypothetical protein